MIYIKDKKMRKLSKLFIFINFMTLALVSQAQVEESISFIDNTESFIYYDEESYVGEHSKEDVKEAIKKGINYWKECINKDVVLKDQKSEFKIIWSESLSTLEWGAANYKQKNSETISFTIELNHNKKLSLKEIEIISAHEFGHTLGIRHTLNTNSIMNYNGAKILTQDNNQQIDNSSCKQKFI